MLSVDHQQASSFQLPVMTASYPHNNSFDQTMGVAVDKSQSQLENMSPPSSASSASSHSQMLFAGEQNDFSQQANPFSHHPPPQVFPEHPTPSHASNVDHAMTLNPAQLRSSIGPSRVLTRRQARAQQQQQQLSQTNSDVTDDNNLSSQTPHGNTLNEGFMMYQDPARPQTPIRLSPSNLNHPQDHRPQLTDLSIGTTMLSMQSAMASPPNPSTPASTASSGYSHYGFHPYATHSRSASSSTHPRSASPAISVISAATSMSSSSSTRRHVPFSVPLSPPSSKPKKRLYNKERKAICQYYIQNPNARQEDIAATYGVERSTVSKILKHKAKWLAISEVEDNQVAKHRPSKFPEVEASLVTWLEQCRVTKTLISDVMIRTKAKESAKFMQIGEDKFKASAGWVENFKHRHGIKKGVWVGKPHTGYVDLDFTHEEVDMRSHILNASGAYNFDSTGDVRREQQLRSAQASWPPHSVNGISMSPPSGPFAASPDSLSNPQASNGDLGDQFRRPTGIIIQGGTIVGYGQNDMQSWGQYSAPPPSVHEANEAMDKVMEFVRAQPTNFISQEESMALTSVKELLMMTANNLPDCRARPK